LPTAHLFDEFYGIPPDDSAMYVDTIELTRSIPFLRDALPCDAQTCKTSRTWLVVGQHGERLARASDEKGPA